MINDRNMDASKPHRLALFGLKVPGGGDTILAGVVIALVLAAWSLATYTKEIDRFFLPPPAAVLEAARDMLLTAAFWRDLEISCFRIMSGFLLAAIAAVPIGVLMGRSRLAFLMISPFVSFVRYVPMPAVIPLMILWFGSGEFGKTAIIALGVFFQAVLMIADNVAHVPKEYLDIAKSVHATKWQSLTHFVLPSAQPAIWDSLRINFGLAWATLIFAEILGATSGLGYAIVRAQRFLLVEQVYVIIIVIGILGILIDVAMIKIYARLYPWRPVSTSG